MQEWQASQIWPYSCYGPVGGKPNVPGFEDLSPEEYRFSYFVSGGNVPPQITQQYQQMSLLRQNYQVYTQENRNVIERIATANVPTTPTGVQGGGSFGMAQQTSGNVFGGSFGGGGGGSSIFGGGSTTVTPVVAPGGIFGQSAGGGGVFQAQVQQPQQSVFGGGQAQPQQSLFGGAPASGGLFQAPQQSVFGGGQPQVQQQPQQQVTPSFFPQQPGAGGGGMFQQPQQVPQQQSVLPQTQAPQQSIFGGGGNMFGGGGAAQQVPQQQPPPPYGGAPSIFGGPTGNSPLAQGGFTGGAPAPQSVESIQATSVQQKYVYSNESELSAEEIEAFKASDFSVDNLPSKPPPSSLCL